MAFWKNDDSFAPFNVPQVGPTIPAMPMPDAKDSELAKLRADLDQSRRDRNSAVECAEVLRGYVAAHKAALAAARAALANLDWSDATGHTFMDLRRALEKAGTNPWRTDHGGADRVQVAIDCVRQLCTEIQSSRAALDGERAALAAICDEQASLAKRDRCHSEAGTLHQIAVMIRARRAAEAQPTPVRCPECDGTGRRVKYHGGSINDPNLIGLAMESLPCRCQAAEARP